MSEAFTYATPEQFAGDLHATRFGGGLAASGQQADFGGNVFGRDTWRTALDLMGNRSYRAFIRDMFGTLPQWQGTYYDSLTNEYPGALPHQVFREVVGGRQLAAEQIERAEYWTGRWNVPMTIHPFSGRQFVIYNSSDSSLLFLIALAKFCRVSGRDVLRDKFIHWRTEEIRTVGEAALRCIEHIHDMFIEAEREGWEFYAMPSTNPRQTSPSTAMRDGLDAYVRHVRQPDGSVVVEPIDYGYVAYLENQALCYEALLAACALFPDDFRVSDWRAQAEILRKATLEAFWDDERGLFVPAIDRHGPVMLESNAQCELLNGPFFDGLAEGPDYIRALVRWLYSPSVMTMIGPRMVSLKDAEPEGEYYAYQLTGAVWGVTTGIITEGLWRHELFEFGYDLGVLRLLWWFERARATLELDYVHRQTGMPVLATASTLPRDARLVIAAPHLGQAPQTWSASRALKVLWTIRHRQSDNRSWQRALWKELYPAIKEVMCPIGRTTAPLEPVGVDFARGRDLQQQRFARLAMSGY